MVSVGDRVQVRDAEGEWGMGTVDSIEHGKAQVTKDDWDMSYEWDECKLVASGSFSNTNSNHIDETVQANESGDVSEEILWQSGDGTEPRLHGTLILEPEHLSKISRFTVEHENTNLCDSRDFVVVYDKFGDVAFFVVDNFFTNDVIYRLRHDAIGVNKKARVEWKWSHVHPDQNDPTVFAKGNGFPGMRSQNLPDEVTEMVTTCLKPILAQISDFDLDNDVKEHQSL
jgi:hypothetical protein